MTLTRLEISNFLSYTDQTLDVSSNLISISGDNGVGKSSLLEAIVWGLFGKTQRNSLDKHIPNVNFPDKAGVKLIFSWLEISRQKNPTYFSYTKDGVLIRKKTNSETQDDLEKEIKINYKTFVCTSYYDDALKSPFLELTAEERRQIICNYFDFSDFLRVRKTIKESIDEQNSFLKAVDLLASTKTLQKAFKKRVDTAKEKIRYLTFWHKALGDDCIIKNLLSPIFVSLSAKINEYLKLVFSEDIFCSILADYEIYLRIDGKELSPKSLSLSQRKRLNLAIMLALGEVLDDIHPPKLKLRIFDEFTSIDAETRKLFANLLIKLSEKYQVFVISHDSDLINLLPGQKIVVSMENKISKFATGK